MNEPVIIPVKAVEYRTGSPRWTPSSRTWQSTSGDSTARDVGVTKNRGGWQAAICKDQWTYYLGWFASRDDAVVVRRLAEKFLFGSWSRHVLL